MTEDEIVGWYHRVDGHEFEQAPGIGNGQGNLLCYSPWGCKESDMTEQLNLVEKIIFVEKLELTVLISFHVGIYWLFVKLSNNETIMLVFPTVEIYTLFKNIILKTLACRICLQGFRNHWSNINRGIQSR